jgi:putative transposase
MPRQARLDTPGLLHHVMARGIERRSIFLDKADYADFLARIEDLISRFPLHIFAWALMPNHFHLLVRSDTLGIGPFMKRLMTGYAVSFNLRHERVGHLFQNRYKSIVCEEGPYLLELVRYIHLNPLRAKLVADLSSLGKYPYTGHGVLMGNLKCHWQEKEEVLALFSKKTALAEQKYLKFVQDGVEQGERPDLQGGGLIRSQGGIRAVMENAKQGHWENYDSRILGSGEFVAMTIKSAEIKSETEVELKKRGFGVPEFAKRFAQEEGVELADLFRKGRTEAVSRAKGKLIYCGVEYLGRSNREMAYLTRMSDPSASNARKRAAPFFHNFNINHWLKLIN